MTNRPQSSLLTLSCLIVIACSSAKGPSSAPNDTRALRAILDRWGEYLKAGQFDSLATISTADCVIIEGGRQIPIHQVVEAFRRMQARDFSFQIVELGGAIRQDLGYLLETSDGSYATGATGARRRVHELSTIVFRRDNTGWKIAVWSVTESP